MMCNYIFSISNNYINIVILVRISYLTYDSYVIDLSSIFTPVYI